MLSPSDKTWESWRAKILLPDTQPGSAHEGLRLACGGCGEVLIDSDETTIFKIKQDGLWVIGEPPTMCAGEQAIWNRHKRCWLYQLTCGKCYLNLGSLYREPYPGVEPDKAFPCAKVSIKSTQGQLTLVPVGIEADVRAAVAKLRFA